MTNYEHYDFSLVFYCIHATAFNDGYPGQWKHPKKAGVDGSVSATEGGLHTTEASTLSLAWYIPGLKK